MESDIDDYCELAAELLGLDVDSTNYYEIEFKFYEKYNIDLADFVELVKDLVKFTNPWQSPLSGELYQGFVTKERDGIMRAIIKEKTSDL